MIRIRGSNKNAATAFSPSLVTSRNEFVRPSLLSLSQRTSSSSSCTTRIVWHHPQNQQHYPTVRLSNKLQLHMVSENNVNNKRKTNHHSQLWWNSGIVNNFYKKPLITTAMSLLTIISVVAAAIYSNPALASSTVAASTAANAWMVSIAETGFYQAFSLVFVSEIGDKTFFIAGLLAMKTSKFISFIGSMAALAVMTIISVVIGQLFHAVPAGLIGDGMTIPFDDIAAVLAFAFFGIKTLRESLAMSDGESGSMGEELEEAKQVVDEQDTTKSAIQTIIGIFALVFAAEFGDRSFISTIALSAAQNPISVAGGAIAAHAAATGLAVSGGAVIAKYLSEKVIGIIGGTLFIVFAITTAFGIF